MCVCVSARWPLLDLFSVKGCMVIQSAGWSKLMALTQERGKHSDVDNTDVCFCVGVLSVFIHVYSV